MMSERRYKVKGSVISFAVRPVTERINKISKEEENNSKKEGKRDNELLERLLKIKKVRAVRDNKNNGDFIENVGINGRKRMKKKRRNGKKNKKETIKESFL
jgi:hypothetical protein